MTVALRNYKILNLRPSDKGNKDYKTSFEAMKLKYKIVRVKSKI